MLEKTDLYQGTALAVPFRTTSTWGFSPWGNPNPKSILETDSSF